MKAYDMGRYYRVVGNEGSRIRGTWVVMKSPRDGERFVYPHDVVIWDEAGRGGMVFRAEAFTATVTAEGVVIGGIGGHAKHDLEDARDELIVVVRQVAEAAVFEGATDE